MPEQLIIKDAGVPGAPNSYYSEEQTLSALADVASPAVAAYTVIPQIGFIMFADLAAGLSVVLKVDDSPETYVTIVAAGSQGLIWSDGANCYVLNATADDEDVNYYVLAAKP